MSSDSEEEAVIIKPEKSKSKASPAKKANGRETSAGPSNGRKGKKRARTAPDSDEEEQEEEGQDGDSDEEEDDEEEDNEAPALVRGEGGYVTGSIVRMAMHNFVTYDHVEFSPGPDLNMILGPNGNGKSTIACAIAIGLGFPLKVLNRQNKISSFVKNTGESNEGWVEVELKGQPGERNAIIRRYLKRDEESTNFTINGQSATHKAVSALMADLNVQVNNLCTFLPQDRVANFAQMSIQELLKETEKAAGDARLHDWHMTLIAEHKVLKESRGDVERLAEALKRKKEKQASTEKDVSQFNARKALEDEIRVLELLLPFAEYQTKHVAALAARADKAQSKEDLLELEAAHKPLLDSHKALEEMVKYYDQMKTKTKVDQGKVNEDLAAKQKQLTTCDADATKVRESLDQIKDRAQRIRADLLKYKAEVAKQQAIVDNKPDAPDSSVFLQKFNENRQARGPIEARLDAADTELHRLKRDIATHAREKQRAEDTLKQLHNVQNQRDAKCQKFDQQTWYAVVWLRQNLGRFKGKVFEPPRLSISLKNKQTNPDLAEAQISAAAFRTFLFEDVDDYRLMMAEINDKEHYVQTGEGKKRVKINGATVPTQSYSNEYSQEALDTMGFVCHALDLIQGPEQVLAYLCGANKLHMTPISDGKRPLNDAEIARRRVGRYYTPNHSVSTITSKYNGAVQTESRTLQAGKVLSQGLDEGKIDEAKAQIKAVTTRIEEFMRQVRTVEEEKSECTKQLEQLSKEKQAIQAAQEKAKKPLAAWETAKVKLSTAKKEVQTLLSRPSQHAEEAGIREKLAKLTTKRIAIAVEHTDFVFKFSKLHQRMVAHQLNHLQAEADYAALGASFAEKSEQIAAKHLEHQEISARSAKLGAEVKELGGKLKEVLSECDDETRAKVTARREAETPDFEVITQELEETRTRLNVTVTVSPAVLAQYNKVKVEIEELEEKYGNASEKLESSESKSKRVLKKWFPKLTSLVAQISTKFSNAFDHLGLLGEVRIHDEDDDYDKWGIQIMVSFRDTEELKPLNGQRQSGGERALCTVMYLMSLAELAKAPFALVDEINQGMDQRVERHVHNALVKTTCKDDVGQYFLITPKLLPNLEYHPKMKVLTIHNGAFLSPTLKLDKVVAERMKRNKAQGGAGRA